MSVLFSHTMRGIRSYSPRYINFAKVLAILVLVVWGYWFFFSQIKVYEISEQGKLVISPGPFSVETTSSGRLQKNHVRLGHRVQEGDLLVELDTSADRLELNEVLAQLQMLRGQVDRLQQEAEALEQINQLLAEKEDLSIQAELSQVEKAENQAKLAMREAALIKQLFKEGMAGKIELLRAESELGGSEAEVNLRKIDAARARQAGAAGVQMRQALIMERQRLGQEKGDELEVLRARAQLLEHRVEQGRIRAVGSGVVASIEDLPAGVYVNEGRRIATILPRGELSAVAWFPPRGSLGKIFAGQEALVKLDGFPWTRFGGLRAEVAMVGAEPENGLIRVELKLNRVDAGRSYLRHGLPGSVEIVIDELSPAGLLMHMLGRELREGPMP